MNRLCKIAFALAAAVALCACQTPPNESGAADAASSTLVQVRTADYRIRSAVNDREYRISVILPPNYDLNGTSRHGVFYIYDGTGPNYQDFAQVSSLLGAQTPDVIWVGFGPGEDLTWDAGRAADTTPTNRPAFDETTRAGIAQAALEAGTPMGEEVLAALPVSGQAAAFLDVLEHEVIPLIETSYRANGDRALAGHSFGGLFAGYALLERPGLFDRFLMSSPSFWWDEYMMLERQAAFADVNEELPARVFMSVGADEGEDMLRSKREFEAGLRARGYVGLTLETAEFEGADHMGAVLPAFMNGVPYLYSED